MSSNPLHCRSFVVSKTDDRFIVSKGNGLSYTEWTFLNTGELGDDTLGLLLKKDALRGFHIGNEIASLGIRTNRMEYVLDLNTRESLFQMEIRSNRFYCNMMLPVLIESPMHDLCQKE